MIWRTLLLRIDALGGSPGSVIGRFTRCLGIGGIHINTRAVCVVRLGGARARCHKVLRALRQHTLYFRQQTQLHTLYFRQQTQFYERYANIHFTFEGRLWHYNYRLDGMSGLQQTRTLCGVPHGKCSPTDRGTPVTAIIFGHRIARQEHFRRWSVPINRYP